MVGGDVESVTRMILTEPSLKADGYKVLPKGQCVIVTTFSNNPYRMVKANDGRIGIIPAEKERNLLAFKMYKYEEVVALNWGICGFILNYGLREERQKTKTNASRISRNNKGR